MIILRRWGSSKRAEREQQKDQSEHKKTLSLHRDTEEK